jgi:hypothetical protein
MKLFNNKNKDVTTISTPSVKAQDVSAERTLFLIKASRILKNMERFNFSIESNACYK